MTRLGVWLDGAIARRLAFGAIVITTVTLALGMVGGVGVTAWSEQRRADLEADHTAKQVAAAVAASLHDAGSALAALAASSLVINGLSDAAILEETVQPLLDEHVLRPRYDARLHLCDSFRRSIAASQRAEPAAKPDAACGTSPDFDQALSKGAPVARVEPAPEGAALVWIVPIRLPATRTFEGAIVAHLPLATLLRQAAGQGGSTTFMTLRLGDQSVTVEGLRRKTALPERRVMARVPLAAIAGGVPLDVQVEIGIEAPAIPWAQIIGGYGIAAVLLAALAAGAAVMLARRLTRPYAAIGELAASAQGMLPDAWTAHARRQDEAGDLARGLQRRTAQLVRQIDELREARQEAEAANRAKSEFLATMSHELRTPLSAVTGLAALALHDSGSNRQAHLQQLQRSALTLRLLVDDVLDMSRIESGRLEIAPVACSVADIVAAVCDATKPTAAEKGLAFDVDVAPDVPPHVRVDPLRVIQVLTNLVGNAVKFTEHGSVQLRVRTLATWLRFEVVDTGIGIDPTDLRHIFDAFRQADASTARRFGGSGLGLAICKKLVDLMGGEIEVDSTPQQGSRFVVRLPLVVEAMAGPTLDASPATGRDLAQALEGRAVLAVDDAPLNLLLAQAMLEEFGIDVVQAGSGEEALQMLASPEHRIGIVLMDCHMPGMDGYETTRCIRLQPALARIPVVACTADVFTDGHEAGRIAGMDDYVSKPLDLDLLVASMSRALRKRQAG